VFVVSIASIEFSRHKWLQYESILLNICLGYHWTPANGAFVLLDTSSSRYNLNITEIIISI
jgi:hypothetical protein